MLKLVIMNALTPWNIIGVFAIVALLLSFKKGRNSVWGALTLGVVLGFVISIFYYFKDSTFYWSIVKNTIAVCVLIGFVYDILFRLISGREK